MARPVLWISLVALLSGCQGMKYALDNYTGVDVQHFTLAPDASPGSPNNQRAETFRIFDKPQESRLMITPSVAASAGMAAVSGLTLGGASRAGSPARMREAVTAYLASTDRVCTIDALDLVVEPQYEARYRCEATNVQLGETYNPPKSGT